MSIKGIFYISLYASDFVRSKSFYGETLGWEIGTDEEHVAGFHFGSAYLVLIKESRPKEEQLFGGGLTVEVQVEDIETEYNRLKNLGVKVSPLEQKPWGERNFSFSDPDGYVWYYGEA